MGHIRQRSMSSGSERHLAGQIDNRQQNKEMWAIDRLLLARRPLSTVEVFQSTEYFGDGDQVNGGSWPWLRGNRASPSELYEQRSIAEQDPVFMKAEVGICYLQKNLTITE